jgi:hypothetical protein
VILEQLKHVGVRGQAFGDALLNPPHAQCCEGSGLSSKPNTKMERVGEGRRS